ncbi:membrane protein [Devosia yakushimensis]|uniref:Membrane protein n=1 Tax=Devosia yakushimensis TaxID=470028 RepID=A0ABQ5UMC9_9HYPH|nr:BrnT family toxin [Devosia yakushimensis]GLQ12348.1 membrane protein [Devosia yakushimensis]
MEFEWDEDKNRSNKLKHGISFEAAIEIFDDPFELTEFDQFVDGEERWKTLGAWQHGWSVLVVVHVERDRADALTVRIISARAANKDERKRYERNRRKDR